MMQQIFITGASMTYGVGGAEGGWADMIKRSVHQQIFGENPSGKRMEVYNFARPGMVVQDVLDSIENDIKYRKQESSEVTIIVSIGMNNTRAQDEPDNFQSTIEDYQDKLSQLLDKLSDLSGRVVFVGYTPVDEARTTPKQSSIRNAKSYFWNERIAEFDAACRAVCEEKSIEHIDLFSAASGMENWLEYLSSDGLHVNSRGHEWIFNQVWPALSEKFGF